LEYTKNLDINTKIKNVRNLATDSNIIFKSNLIDEEEYFVRDITLPGITTTAVEAYRPNTPFHTSMTFEGDTIVYDPLTVTVLLDEDLSVFKTLVNKVKLASNGDLSAFPKDRSRSWVTIKDSNGNTRMKIIYKDCVLTDIGGIDYSSASIDDPLSISITMAYSEFIIEDVKPSSKLQV